MKKVKRFEGKVGSTNTTTIMDSASSPESIFHENNVNATTVATAAVSSPKTTIPNTTSGDDSFHLDTSTLSAAGNSTSLREEEFDIYHIEIPHEVIPNNDIEDMIRIAMNGKVSEKNRLVSNLTEFVFTYTIENLPSHQSRAPLDQIWYEAGLKFDEILIQLPNETIWQERLFKYFPNQTWPKELIDYINELKSKKPSQTWLNKTPRVMERSIDDQNITYFGNLLRDRYLTVRNFIKWHLHKKWKEPDELPVGWTLNKLLYAIRKSLWPAECRRRYIETVSRKARRQKLPEDETRLLTETPRETKRWDPNWYPSQWLTFLFLNPGPAKHVDYMFSSTSSGHHPAYLATYAHGYDDDDDSSEEDAKEKKDGSRKRSAATAFISKAIAAPMTPGGTVLDPSDEQKRRDCEVSIRALERKLAILTRQGRPDEELREVENELLECLSIQANAYKKYRPNDS
eukprot:gene5415-5811_t